MSDDYGVLDSEWNEAKAYFFRIHNCLVGSDEASLRDDHHAHLKYLFALHRELSGQMSKEELETAEKCYKDVKSKIFFTGARNVDQEIIVSSLYSYELFLRKILKDRKMDLPRAKDPKRGLEDG